MIGDLLLGCGYNLYTTLPETNIAPKNGCLDYYCPFGFRPIFSGELLVSGRVCHANPGGLICLYRCIHRHFTCKERYLTKVS